MSLAEIFKNAMMQTILGMGVVFAVLIFIAFIISLFKYLPELTERFNISKKTEIETPIEQGDIVLETGTTIDEGVIVAVISAAIRAAMNENEPSLNGYFVRSIKRV